jgi:hypothetical protein
VLRRISDADDLRYNRNMTAEQRSALLDRIFEPAGDSMPPEVARWLLDLRADQALQERVDELADKNTEGAITPEDLAEYDEYLQIAGVVAALQSRARKVLSQANGRSWMPRSGGWFAREQSKAPTRLSQCRSRRTRPGDHANPRLSPAYLELCTLSDRSAI